jgi:PhnB protein
MKINPYLHFDGDCQAAFQTYARVFHARLGPIARFGDSPMASQTGPEWKDKVMHVDLHLDGQTLMGSDAPPPHFKTPQGFAVCIEPDGEAEAERIFRELSEGGKISMPLQETFWAKKFAMFTDRYGSHWMINMSKPVQ